MINKGTNYLTKEQQKKLDDIVVECNRAINEQNNRQKVLGYGLDDYTEGRIVGAANLARKINRIILNNRGV
jgi:hypothetical protein